MDEAGSSSGGRLVVGVDDSPGARAALVWALRTAAPRGWTVEVVTALVVDYYWQDAYLLDPRRIDEARQEAGVRVAGLVDEVRSDPALTAATTGVDVRVAVVVGAAAEHLVDLSGTADLLVVGSRGSGAVRGALLGSVSLRCVMHARCPLVVVHEADSAPAGDGVPTVVVGVDGSPPARAALVVAADEARRRGARLEVVAAYRPAGVWSDVPLVTAVTADELRSAVRSTATAEVSAVLGDDPPVEVVVEQGAPAEVLVERARNAELLVVGSRGQGTLPGLVLGSVALRAVARAHCPVMVVHRAARGRSDHPLDLESSAAQT